jgi:hypothetical protein
VLAFERDDAMKLILDMPTASASPEVWTREEAIGRLRAGLLKLSDGEHSMCQVAADLGVFCRGFRRWNDHEFHQRWKKVIGQSTHLTRPQMEEFADLWQLTEQLRLRVPLACDAQTLCPGACRGWNEFSNEYLERCCDEILGWNVVIRIESAQIAQNDPGRREAAPRP